MAISCVVLKLSRIFGRGGAESAPPPSGARVVRPENKLAHVIKLQRMKQDSGQTIAHFSANIRAAARQCQFHMSCKCTKRVSYEEHMVLYQLLSGLEDAEVQADLLAKTNLTLEKYVINREMARRSQSTVHEEHGEVGRLRSSYKKQKSAVTGVTPAAALCRHCGEHAHQNRRLECKAYSHICSCGQRGHLPKVCFNQGKPRRLPPEKQEVISADGVYELATRFAIVTERGSVDIVAQSRGNRLPVTVCVDVHMVYPNSVPNMATLPSTPRPSRRSSILAPRSPAVAPTFSPPSASSGRTCCRQTSVCLRPTSPGCSCGASFPSRSPSQPTADTDRSPSSCISSGTSRG